MARCLICLVLVLLPDPLRAAQQPAPGEARVLPCSARGLPILEVAADGGAIRLGLDTGTSRSLIAADAAERLHLIPRARFSLATTGGPSTPGLCAPADLRVGGIRLHADCLGWLPAERHLAGAEDLEGILGADLLAQLDLWIDLGRCPVRARLGLPGTLAAMTDGTRLKVDLVGRRAAIEAQILDFEQSIDVRLVLDSGSDGLILFGDVATRLEGTMRVQRGGARLTSAVAARSVDVAAVRGVRVGTLHLDGVRAAGLLPEILDRPEDGLLPLSALGPVLLDLSNRFVIAGARFRDATRE